MDISKFTKVIRCNIYMCVCVCKGYTTVSLIIGYSAFYCIPHVTATVIYIINNFNFISYYARSSVFFACICTLWYITFVSLWSQTRNSNYKYSYFVSSIIMLFQPFPSSFWLSVLRNIVDKFLPGYWMWVNP